MLPVDWNAIVRGDGSTNWQLFPGDRVFLSRLGLTDLIEAAAALLHGEPVELRPLPLQVENQAGVEAAEATNTDDQTVDTKQKLIAARFLLVRTAGYP